MKFLFLICLILFQIYSLAQNKFSVKSFDKYFIGVGLNYDIIIYSDIPESVFWRTIPINIQTDFLYRKHFEIGTNFKYSSRDEKYPVYLTSDCAGCFEGSINEEHFYRIFRYELQAKYFTYSGLQKRKTSFYGGFSIGGYSISNKWQLIKMNNQPFEEFENIIYYVHRPMFYGTLGYRSYIGKGLNFDYGISMNLIPKWFTLGFHFVVQYEIRREKEKND